MAIIKCPECGHQVSDRAATCPSCGVEIAGKVVKCPECGSVVFSDQELCPNCHCDLHEGHAGEEPTAAGSTVPVVQPVVDRDDAAQHGTEKNAVPPTPADGKPRKRGYTALVVTVVILLIVGFVATYFYKNSQDDSEKSAYAEAMLSDQPSVLQNFLDIYKDAPQEHRDSIEAHLTMLMSVDKEWTDAVVSNSKAAIERFLKMHPNSPHTTEAKVKIDSLDWVSASKTNTQEALQAYLDSHTDGLYYDQAKDMLAKLEAQQVSADDRSYVSSLYSGFFKALAADDEDGVTANTANVMTSFLHKANATKNDVVKYMKDVHSKAGQHAVEFRTNNDWKIDKAQSPDGLGYIYNVKFSVDQKVAAAEGETATIVTYQVESTISSDGKISELNMKKMIQ